MAIQGGNDNKPPVITKPGKAVVIQNGSGNKRTGFAPLNGCTGLLQQLRCFAKTGYFSTVILCLNSHLE